MSRPALRARTGTREPARLLLRDLNTMEGLLTTALGSRMPIPAKQALGFIGTRHPQNTHLLNTSQGHVKPFYGMKHVILYQLRM